MKQKVKPICSSQNCVENTQERFPALEAGYFSLINVSSELTVIDDWIQTFLTEGVNFIVPANM